MNTLRTVSRLTAALLVAVLTACGSGGGTDGAPGAASKSLAGIVRGGQSPVSGSAVTLYAVGTGSLSSANLLATGTTDANGSFNLSSYTCPSSTSLVYLVAAGGNPGLASGTNNAALQLMAALGPCGSTPNSVNVDEVTTVAAAYAVNGFIGNSGCVDCSVGLPGGVTNVHGKSPELNNAFTTAALLANVSAGSVGSLPVSAQQQLDALANSLAACVNTTSGNSSQCTELFHCATPGATFSGGACTVPAGSALATDTLTAILEIARNSGRVAIAGIYDVATRNAVFSPTLSAAPTSWALALSHTGGGLNRPNGVAIDANGNVWVANTQGSDVSEFGPTGLPISPNGGYTGGGVDTANELAIDASGNVWVATLTGKLGKLNSSGAALGPSGGYTGGGLAVGQPSSIAIDSSGNVWVTDYVANSGALSEFNSSGTAISPSTGYTGGGLNDPEGIAIDSSGNLWVGNTGANGFSKFSSSGLAISSGSGYTGGGLTATTQPAIDGSGNVWGAYSTGNLLGEFNASGTPLSPSTGFTGGGLNFPRFIAIDAGGNVWVSNQSGSTISEFSSAGTALSPSTGFDASGFVGTPQGIAIDASGNVWFSNYQNSSLTELVGAAVPTRTPLVTTITQGLAP